MKSWQSDLSGDEWMMYGIKRNQQFAALILEKSRGQGYADFPDVFLTYLEQRTEEPATVSVQHSHFLQIYYEVLLKEIPFIRSLSMINQTVLHRCMQQNIQYYQTLSRYNQHLTLIANRHTKGFRAQSEALREQLHYFFTVQEKGQTISTPSKEQERSIAKYIYSIKAVRQVLTAQQNSLVCVAADASIRSRKLPERKNYRFFSISSLRFAQVAASHRNSVRAVLSSEQKTIVLQPSVDFKQLLGGTRETERSGVARAYYHIAQKTRQVLLHQREAFHSVTSGKQSQTAAPVLQTSVFQTIRLYGQQPAKAIGFVQMQQSAGLLQTQKLLYAHYLSSSHHIPGASFLQRAETPPVPNPSAPGARDIPQISTESRPPVTPQTTYRKPAGYPARNIRGGAPRLYSSKRQTFSMGERIAEWFHEQVNAAKRPQENISRRAMREHPVSTASYAALRRQGNATKPFSVDIAPRADVPQQDMPKQSVTKPQQEPAKQEPETQRHFAVLREQAVLESLRGWIHRRIILSVQSAETLRLVSSANRAAQNPQNAVDRKPSVLPMQAALALSDPATLLEQMRRLIIQAQTENIQTALYQSRTELLSAKQIAIMMRLSHWQKHQNRPMHQASMHEIRLEQEFTKLARRQATPPLMQGSLPPDGQSIAIEDPSIVKSWRATEEKPAAQLTTVIRQMPLWRSMLQRNRMATQLRLMQGEQPPHDGTQVRTGDLTPDETSSAQLTTVIQQMPLWRSILQRNRMATQLRLMQGEQPPHDGTQVRTGGLTPDETSSAQLTTVIQQMSLWRSILQRNRMATQLRLMQGEQPPHDGTQARTGDFTPEEKSAAQLTTLTRRIPAWPKSVRTDAGHLGLHSQSATESAAAPEETAQADLVENLLAQMRSPGDLRHRERHGVEQSVTADRVVSQQRVEEYLELSSSRREEETSVRESIQVRELQQQMEKRLNEVTKELETVRSQSTERTVVRKITKEVMREMQEQLHLERMRRGLS